MKYHFSNHKLQRWKTKWTILSMKLCKIHLHKLLMSLNHLLGTVFIINWNWKGLYGALKSLLFRILPRKSHSTFEINIWCDSLRPRRWRSKRIGSFTIDGHQWNDHALIFMNKPHRLKTLKSTSSINETDLDCTNRTDLVDDFKNRLVEIENRLDSLPETA